MAEIIHTSGSTKRDVFNVFMGEKTVTLKRGIGMALVPAGAHALISFITKSPEAGMAIAGAVAAAELALLAKWRTERSQLEQKFGEIISEGKADTLWES